MRKYISQKMRDYNGFCAETRKQLYLRGWKYKDLADAVGYSPNYVTNAMNDLYASRRLVRKIMEVLDIPTKPYL